MAGIITDLKSLGRLFARDVSCVFQRKGKIPAADERSIDLAKKLEKRGIVVVPDFISEKAGYELYEKIKAGAVDTSPCDQIMEIVAGRKDLYLSHITLYDTKENVEEQYDHIYNYTQQIYTGILYLTDIDGEPDGAYVVVEGTQRFSFIPYFNLIANILSRRADIHAMPLKFGRKKTMVTAKKGTLVLLDPRAIHGKYKLQEDKEHLAIVFYYLLVSANDYEDKSTRRVIRNTLRKIN